MYDGPGWYLVAYIVKSSVEASLWPYIVVLMYLCATIVDIEVVK